MSELTAYTITEATESAAHWGQLATDADRMGDWERDRGRYDGVYRNKAESYRNVAKACQLEAKTGIPHCACCLKPNGHERPYWKR